MSFFPFIGLELTFFCFGRFGFSSWFRLQPETSLQDALLSWARDERCGMNALGFVSFHTFKDWFDTCGRYSIQVWVVLCIRTFVPSQNNQHWLLWIASPLEAWTNVSVFRSFCYPTSYLADMCFALPKGDLLFCPALLIGYSQLTSISRGRSPIRNLGSRWMGVPISASLRSHNNTNNVIIWRPYRWQGAKVRNFSRLRALNVIMTDETNCYALWQT